MSMSADNEHSSLTYRGYMICFAACFLHISTGAVLAWPSPSIPHLVKQGITTENQGAWIVSILAAGGCIGPIFITIFLETYGRKGTLLGTMGIYVMGWIVLGCSVNFYLMCFGRFILGIGVSLAFIAVPVYISEIADDKSRNMLNPFCQMFFGIGFLIEYCFGPVVNYDTLIAVSAAPACMFGILFAWFVPETPHYLLMSGNKAEAIHTLKRLRTANLNSVESDIKHMEISLAEAKLIQGKKLDLILKRGPRKALIISVILLTAQHICGYNTIIVYTEKIFTLANASLSPTTSSILTGFCNVFPAFLAAPLVRRFGLKLTIIISSLGVALCMGLLSIYFGLKDYGISVSSIGYLPVLSIMASSVFFCLGLSSLPWAVIAEIFTRDQIACASCVCGVFNSWCLLVIVQESIDVLNNLGMFPVSIGFTICGLITLVLIIILLPNTKNLSFQQIQDLINGDQISNASD